jgi:hypothetical protein
MFYQGWQGFIVNRNIRTIYFEKINFGYGKINLCHSSPLRFQFGRQGGHNWIPIGPSPSKWDQGGQNLNLVNQDHQNGTREDKFGIMACMVGQDDLNVASWCQGGGHIFAFGQTAKLLPKA